MGSLAQALWVVDVAGEPIAYAVVELPNTQGKPLVSSVGNNGHWVPPAAAGFPLVISVKALGYLPQSDTLQKGETLRVVLQEDPMEMDGVVVTGQYEPHSADAAVHQVRVLTREWLDAQGAVTLADVMQYELNLQVRQDPVLGAGLSMQGVGGQNIKILVDGVPVIGRQDGQIDLGQLDLSNVERIEWIEGPMSVQYGSDALAGTLNLITKRTPAQSVGGGINAYAETAGQYNSQARLHYGKGKHRWSLSGGRNFFDGWSPSDAFWEVPGPRLADTLRAKSWNAKAQGYGRLDYTYSFEKGHVKPYMEGFSEKVLDRGFPRLPYYEQAFDDVFLTHRLNAGLDWRWKWGQGIDFLGVAAYNYFRREKHTYLKDLTTLSSILTPQASDHDTTHFSAAMSRGSWRRGEPGAKWRAEVGYDLLWETAQGLRIANGRQFQGDFASFITAEWMPHPSLTLRPGLRAAYNTQYPAPIVPSLHIRYAQKSWIVRASYARGFRAPSLKEQYLEFVDVNHHILGNSALKAEYSHNVQVNLSRKWVWGKHLIAAEAGGYGNQIRNLITLGQVPGTTQFTYVNVGNARTVGLQAGIEWKKQGFLYALKGVWAGQSAVLSDGQEDPGFLFTPEIQQKLSAQLPRTHTTLGIVYKWNGLRQQFADLGGGNVGITSLDGYHLWDISLTQPMAKERLKWIVGVNNLLNVQSVAVSGSAGGTHAGSSGLQQVGWGRSVFLSVQYQFLKNVE